MDTFISHSAQETQQFGEEWGRRAPVGAVIALTGDLGTGKTQFVKGLARGLGISRRVQSPTFSLLNIYEGGRLRLYHLDLYRLDTPAQVVAAGLDEFFQPDGIAVVEWAERWFGQLSKPCPDSVRWVAIEAVGNTERRITYEDPGY